MTEVYSSPVVRFAGRLQAPLLQLYALYVLLHGHYSPGGGFQAGAALAASYLILRIAEGEANGMRGFTPRVAMRLAYAGVLLYALTGLISMIFTQGFLDYGGLEGLPWPMPGGAATRAIGTLVIEIGVTMAVMGVLVAIFDDLMAPERKA